MKVETQQYRVKDAAVLWFLGIVSFAIIACNPTTVSSMEQLPSSEVSTPITTVIHIPKMDHYEGFTTQERIVIIGDGTPEEFTEVFIHETKHLIQIEEAGGTIPFWAEYWLNPQQACKWEKEAGAPNHQVCTSGVLVSNSPR